MQKILVKISEGTERCRKLTHTRIWEIVHVGHRSEHFSELDKIDEDDNDDDDDGDEDKDEKTVARGAWNPESLRIFSFTRMRHLVRVSRANIPMGKIAIPGNWAEYNF